MVLPYYRFRDELSYAEGLLYRGQLVVVPEALPPEMLEKPGMNVQVKDQAQQCEVCRMLDNKQQKESIQQPELLTLACMGTC
jgi:hypothetical protein